MHPRAFSGGVPGVVVSIDELDQSFRVPLCTFIDLALRLSDHKDGKDNPNGWWRSSRLHGPREKRHVSLQHYVSYHARQCLVGTLLHIISLQAMMYECITEVPGCKLRRRSRPLLLRATSRISRVIDRLIVIALV